mmetsp:Transcript_4036/g.9634  ORF Transcript_4036/g.9634 Transcript_4036/m.9634 type:complete len:283 (-) Transcript_4036:11120-11968(-)
MEGERKRNVLLVDNLDGLRGLAAKQQGIEVDKGVVEHHRRLHDVPHEQKRDRDVVLGDGEPPEGLQDNILLGRVLEHALGLLARQHHASPRQAAKRLGDLHAGSPARVVALPHVLVCHVGWVGHVKPLGVADTGAQALELDDPGVDCIHRHLLATGTTHGRRAASSAEPVGLHELEVAQRALAATAHHEGRRGHGRFHQRVLDRHALALLALGSWLGGRRRLCALSALCCLESCCLSSSLLCFRRLLGLRDHGAEGEVGNLGNQRALERVNFHRTKRDADVC